MRFEIKRAIDGQFYGVISARNGNVLWTTETYTQRVGVRKAMNALARFFRYEFPLDVIDTTKVRKP